MLIRWLYTLLLTFFAPFLLFGLYKKKEGKPSVGSRWKEHFGFTPILKSDNKPLWIHAVSVGETIAVAPLIKQLKAENPETEIVLTTTTSTGAEQAAKLGKLVTHRYMPLDFPFAVKGFIQAINPCKMIIMETELWPNTLYTVAKSGIPISVINARLSERSYQRYSKFQPIFNLLRDNIDQVLCQYKDDADRFIKLGFESKKITITGSIKFDINIDPTILEQGNQLRLQLGPERPIWIAASTHAGEDEQIINAHIKVLDNYPQALLILVPRHPERFNSVFDLCINKGLITERRTKVTTNNLNNAQIYLGDTMGEMLTLLQAANICFVGGSLLGSKVGGHNMLEPAALGKPVLSGPSYFNFHEIAKQLLSNNALSTVEDESSLANSITTLFNNPCTYKKMAEGALKTVSQNKGALNETIRLTTK